MNRPALERSLQALADMVKPEHAALVEVARSLAQAVDAAPDNASLWREYRAALASLFDVLSDAGPSDEMASFLESIRTPAVRPQVGDAADA